jgi:hypothetical protein
MGYTHYYSYDPYAQAFTERWAQAVADTAKIAAFVTEHYRVHLGDAFGDGSPEISTERIALNGQRRERQSLSHETLLIYGPTEEAGRAIEEQKRWFGDVRYIWAFCKTARKPYDLAVTSILLRFCELMPEAFAIGSDGSWTEEWQFGAGYWGPGSERGASPVAIVGTLFGQAETPARSRLARTIDGPPCATGGKRPYRWRPVADE